MNLHQLHMLALLGSIDTLVFDLGNTQCARSSHTHLRSSLPAGWPTQGLNSFVADLPRKPAGPLGILLLFSARSSGNS
eukprot:701958-Pelagomonas_calceolata.AAC.2